MEPFPRPKLVVSRCIEFDHCRYDGSMIPSDFVKALKPYVDFLPVCPEMEIGLGAPRNTLRIVSNDGLLRLIQPATYIDLTDRIKEFTSSFLRSLPEVDGFILKHRSPSCGMKDIRVYSTAAGSGTISKASGFFGGAAIGSFPDLAIEDEGRLRNFNIREHFLTKIYALAALRKARSDSMLSALIRFHEVNKLLLMAHSQKETETLGRIIANHEGLDFIELSGLYRQHLAKALKRPPKAASKANVFLHI
ncbi:MAG: YbgA family protein, partial [Methanothrix sp.]